jgi:hypothetical protein
MLNQIHSDRGMEAMKRRNPLSARRPARRLGALVVALSAVGVLGACDALDNALQVEAPGFVDASDMNNPGNANLLVSGAVADFDCAFGA